MKTNNVILTKSFDISKVILIFIIYNLTFNILNATAQLLSQEQAIQTALKNNQLIKSEIVRAHV